MVSVRRIRRDDNLRRYGFSPWSSWSLHVSLGSLVVFWCAKHTSVPRIPATRARGVEDRARRTVRESQRQIITTSAQVTPNGGLVGEFPQHPLNSGLGNIVICPDNRIFIKACPIFGHPVKKTYVDVLFCKDTWSICEVTFNFHDFHDQTWQQGFFLLFGSYS